MFRIQPQMAVGAYKTYAVAQPSDATVKTACKDAGCLAYHYGWESAVDESTDLGKQQADYIRLRSGRTFKESKTDAGLTVFRFESGQRCFTEHYTKPQIHLVRAGDWRSNLGLIRRHTRGMDWVEDFAEHQDRLAIRLGQG